MSRPDLNSGSPGDWQAFDVTPQMTTDGVYCAGPCAVKAVKRGEIFQRHDCSLVFFDIYADIIHWVLQEDRSWRTVLEKNRTGRRLLTQNPFPTSPSNASVKGSSSASRSSSAVKKSSSELSVTNFPTVDVNIECLDVTNCYKYPQGSEEERATLQRANTFFTPAAVYDRGEGDVKYDIVPQPLTPLGQAFDVAVSVQNTCRFERNVTMTLTLVSIHYTGLTRSRIRSETFNFNLCSLRQREVVLRVSIEDYMHAVGELAMFRVYMRSFVDETEQLTTSFHDFRLTMPELAVMAPKTAFVDEPFDCIVQLASPMLIGLQRCQFMIEAPGMASCTRIVHKELEPYENSQVTVKMFPTRTGRAVIVATFSSGQMTVLTGTAEVFVRDACKVASNSHVSLF
jgi:hypothetical protein